MSNIRKIQSEQKTNLLTNIINNWIKENNKISDNTKNIKFHNVSEWPNRSPFEFYNKNVIIPNINNPQKNIPFNKNEKLKVIKDNITQLISKNISDIEKEKENAPIKVSIHSQNKQTEKGSITIKQTANEEKEENKKILNNINNIPRKDFEEKNIIYNFGYSKEERIEPLKLSLNTKTIYEIENKDSELKNKNEENNNYNFVNDPYKENDNDTLINIEQYEMHEKIKDKKLIEIPKVLIVPKSEKEIAYYKEKDLFDEEIKEKDLNVTNEQMDILENYNHKSYNKFKEFKEPKNFGMIHPYLNYKYHKKNTKDKFYLNEQRKKKLLHILQKQKVIINNIGTKKNYTNIYNRKNNLIKNNSLLNEYQLHQEQKKHLLLRKVFRSYSTNDYYNNNSWEKRQQMLERKKAYSTIVFLNERKNMEERKNARMIRRIRINEERKKARENDKEEENEDGYENEDEGEENKLPEIKQRVNNEEKDAINYEKNKVYTNSYNPLKKYRFKQKEEEKIINTMAKHNPQLEKLLYNNEIYKMKLDDIKSHVK